MGNLDYAKNLSNVAFSPLFRIVKCIYAEEDKHYDIDNEGAAQIS